MNYTPGDNPYDFDLPESQHHKPKSGWVTCPTCNGEVGHWDASIPAFVVCPDCVDGLIPSPELVERVRRFVKPDYEAAAREMQAVLSSAFDDPPVWVDSPMPQAKRVVDAAWGGHKENTL